MVLIACTLHGCGKIQEDTMPAKYIFLFIGDGMGPAQVYAAESWLAWTEDELGGTGRLSFTKFPYTGMITTYSANRNITCSSAAGTALATGHKTNNSVLGRTPDGKDLKAFPYILKDNGYRIGIISNGPVNHATPASFYANADSRHDYYEISLQIPESGFDFFAGDGFKDFNGKDKNLQSIDEVLDRRGYKVCYGMGDYERVEKCDKLILCQDDNRKSGNRDYIVKHTEDSEISLADMVQTAISRFSGDDEPFFIMAEGGTIDWAGHHNRTMALTEKVMELDAAVKAAYRFYLAHPEETLIVVTADHETGGLALGCGNGNNIDWERLSDSWSEAGKKDILDDGTNSELNKASNVGWSGESHTAMPVPVFAVGKGAERFTGWYDNTEIPSKIILDGNLLTY